MKIELIPIRSNGDFTTVATEPPAIVSDIIRATIALYGTVGYEPPWTGYLAIENGVYVGTCGFKSPPQDNRVEIAYFTFPEHESRGIATQMASALVRVALGTRPAVTVAAQTLPEENASTSILKKLDFQFVETVYHPEDGPVWEWHL